MDPGRAGAASVAAAAASAPSTAPPDWFNSSDDISKWCANRVTRYASSLNCISVFMFLHVMTFRYSSSSMWCRSDISMFMFSHAMPFRYSGSSMYNDAVTCWVSCSSMFSYFACRCRYRTVNSMRVLSMSVARFTALTEWGCDDNCLRQVSGATSRHSVFSQQ